MSCVIGLSRGARRHGLSEPIRYVFEVGDDGYPQVESALARAYGIEEQREQFMVGDWGVADKRDTPQLHPADILANQVRYAMMSISNAKDLDVVQSTVSGLIRSQYRYVYAYDRENLPVMKALDDLGSE